MPLLSEFLPVVKMKPEERKTQSEYTKQIDTYHKAVNLFNDTFRCKISPDSYIFKAILQKERETFLASWEAVGSVAPEFSESCLGTTEDYNYLCFLSKYPRVKLSDLKRIADLLSFVIVPLEYVDFKKILSMYSNEDYTYGRKVSAAFSRFEGTIEKCENVGVKQRIYILAPISYYDPWREVSGDTIIPKYFSKNLGILEVTLGLIMPSQRNLYKMSKTNESNVHDLAETMKENFKAVEKSIADCHRKIDWVRSLTEGVVRENNYLKLQLNSLKLKVTELEHQLLCLLDPIIFSLDSKIDISSEKSDDEKAHIGLCFGPDMPLEFFVDKGLTIFNNKGVQEWTYPLHF